MEKIKKLPEKEMEKIAGGTPEEIKKFFKKFLSTLGVNPITASASHYDPLVEQRTQNDYILAWSFARTDREREDIEAQYYYKYKHPLYKSKSSMHY